MNKVKRYYLRHLDCLVEMSEQYRQETGADGVVSGADFDALAAENARLTARVAELERDAEQRVPLYEAIQKAAGELPQGWELRLCIERYAGWVELYDEDGAQIEDFPTNSERLDYTVIDALDAAMAAQAEKGGEA